MFWISTSNTQLRHCGCAEFIRAKDAIYGMCDSRKCFVPTFLERRISSSSIP